MKLVMTEAEAIDAGCTHAGTLYSTPVWVDMRCNSCPAIYPKYAILEPWMWLCDMATMLIGAATGEAWFRITLKRQIGAKGA